MGRQPISHLDAFTLSSVFYSQSGVFPGGVGLSPFEPKSYVQACSAISTNKFVGELEDEREEALTWLTW
jgi:hypothetical protein